jgi:hypothetical protein
MPYNFELTFTQPILTKLDAGQLKDARDWANTITDAYIRTIKLGLPQGVPPTLPAPGLNPIAPPPYPITVSGYNTADSRSRIMYNVIFAYFKAKELKLNKDAIQDVLVDIKRVQKLIRAKKAQLRSLQQQAKNIKEELNSIKQTLPTIVKSIKEEIKNELTELDNLLKSVTDLSVNVSISDLTSVFNYELGLINRLKNLNITDINDVVILANDFNTLQNNFETKDSTKRYLQTRLVSIGSSILGWVNGLNNLPLLLSKLQRTSYQYQRIKRYIDQVEFLSKQLVFVEEEIKKVTTELNEKLQLQLQKLKDRLAKTKANIKKSRANDLFKVVKKIVTEDKRKVEAQLKKVKQQIKQTNDRIVIASRLGGRVVSVGIAIEKEITLFARELKLVKNAINTNVDRTKDAAKVRDYLAASGLLGYANILTTAFIQSQSDFETFKSRFEARQLRYVQIYKELKLIIHDLNTLLKNNYPKAYVIANKLGVSLKELCDWILNKVNPLAQLVKDTIIEQKKKLEDFAKKTLSKTKKQLDEFLVSLIPVNSNIVDPIEKAKARKEKLAVYEEYVNKAKKLSSVVPQLALGAKSLQSVIQNLSQGRYTYSDNSRSIRNIVNAVFAVKGIDVLPSSKSALNKQRENLISQFDRLIVVELATKVLIESFKEMKNSGGLSLFENDINRLKDVIPQSEFDSLQKIINLIKSPPTNPKQLLEVVEGINLEVLNIIQYKNRLLSIEKYYLIRSRQAVQTALDGCEKYNIKNAGVNNTLLSFKKALSKEDSFILFALEVFKTYLKEFSTLVQNKLKDILESLELKIQQQILKNNKLYERLKLTVQQKLVNLDALAMSAVFGLAARLFWTGATWVGPTGVNHVVFSIGFFKPIKARMNDGGSAMIKQIANSYQKQLQLMNGLAIPPPNLLIPPIPFVGYK